VTVGYFEWVQGLIHLFWSEQEVYKRLEELVLKAFDKVFDASDKYKTSLRDAAMRVALERVIEARRLRGLYP
jgi:glutamate dehydrogenase/leucine dehydrogenase